MTKKIVGERVREQLAMEEHGVKEWPLLFVHERVSKLSSTHER